MPNETDEFISEEEALNQRDKDFRNPRQSFKGKTLAPYNQSYRQLALGIREVADSSEFFTASFIYILVRGEEIYQSSLLKNGNPEVAEDAVDLELPREIESDVDGFRFKIRKWMRHFSNEDLDEAGKLLLEAHRRAKASKVEGHDPDAVEEESQTGK